MSEFRIVLQIEQLDENGRPLCTYGPREPVVLLKTDDAELSIELLERMRYTLLDKFDSVKEVLIND